MGVIAGEKDYERVMGEVMAIDMCIYKWAIKTFGEWGHFGCQLLTTVCFYVISICASIQVIISIFLLWPVLWILSFVSFEMSAKLRGAILHWPIGLLTRILPGIRFIVEGEPDFGDSSVGTIVMHNHLGTLDAFSAVNAYVGLPISSVMARAILNIPLVGLALRMGGEIAVEFDGTKAGWGVNKDSVTPMFERCKKLLDNNVNLNVCPEGTRSREGRILPFKDGFFTFAVENGYNILPCALHNTDAIWGPQTLLVNPGFCYWKFGKIVTSTGKTVENLKKEVRDQIIKLRSELPGYDPKLHAPATKGPKSRGGGAFT